jgi:glycosyltransferase involved in cell wall biosynthesis
MTGRIRELKHEAVRPITVVMASPRVSVIIPAFNLARYLPAAIDSALAQEPPGGAVELIVVDDGSTDETPEVLAGYSDRVKVIRQPNGGLVSAVDRGLREVSGEFVALLDADDEWPRDRLVRHVGILERNPMAGLVHGDMEMIDADGQTTHRSFFELTKLRPTDGRVLGRLLTGNFVSGGACTFRSSLLPAIHPIAPDAAYPDWWFAACIAAVGEIVHDTAISNRYRYHGANMGLAAGAEDQPKIHRRELPWRRWMMWNLVDDDTVSVDDVRNAFRAWNFALLTAASGGPGRARELLEVDRAAAAGPLESVDELPQSKALLRAFSRDPFDASLAVDLEVALQRERGAHGPAPAQPAPPLIALEARSRLTLAWLDEITARPELLRAYGEETGNDDASLAVLVPRGADLQGLIELVESDELSSGEQCDIIALPEPVTTPARTVLASRACARLGERAVASPYAELPLHPAIERAVSDLTRAVRYDSTVRRSASSRPTRGAHPATALSSFASTR